MRLTTVEKLKASRPCSLAVLSARLPAWVFGRREDEASPHLSLRPCRAQENKAAYAARQATT
jgi:hypothetical protein